MRSLFFIGVVAVFVSVNVLAVSAKETNSTVVTQEDEEQKSERFVVDLARNFSSFYLQKMTSFGINDRVVSPLSIFMPMSLLSCGIRGKTKRRFLDAIGLKKKKIPMAKLGYRRFISKLAKYDFRMKTKIYVPSNVELTSRFINMSSYLFNFEVEHVDLIDGLMDRKKINEWVAAETHSNGTEFFKPHELGHNPYILFVSTVYFKGTWKYPFDKSRTSLRPFRPVHRLAYNVPTMSVVGRFHHGRLDDLNASFAEFPYQENSEGHGMSLFIILPDEEPHEAWLHLGYRLRNIKPTMLLNGTEDLLEVFIPKFRMEDDRSLNTFFDEILKPVASSSKNRVSRPPSINNRIGGKSPSIDTLVKNYRESVNIDRNIANFPGIFKSPVPSHLGNAASKFVFEIAEEGAQTGESSGIPYDMTASRFSHRNLRSTTSKALPFVVDRPFIAMVVTKGDYLVDILTINMCGRRTEMVPAHGHVNPMKKGWMYNFGMQLSGYTKILVRKE